MGSNSSNEEVARIHGYTGLPSACAYLREENDRSDRDRMKRWCVEAIADAGNTQKLWYLSGDWQE